MDSSHALLNANASFNSFHILFRIDCGAVYERWVGLNVESVERDFGNAHGSKTKLK